jgi:hypothetical protein
MAYCVFLMHKLIVVESSLIGKNMKKLIIEDFMSLMCVT